MNGAPSLRGLRRCSICKHYFDNEELSGCPCGFRVCDECQDFGIYSDEVCCTRCAREIRGGWKDCKRHKYGEPYENELGTLIQECNKCGNPRRAEKP